MEYQVGQAVIFNDGNTDKAIGFIKAEYLVIYELYYLDGDTIDRTKHLVKRPATEAEILAEAQKNGWKLDTYDNYNSPSEDVYFYWHGVLEKYKISANDQQTEDYSVFGNECITAHRLITALNLAKQ